MKPEISIIVPVFNVENYLEDCINSILEQTFEQFEVILINDGSSDQSGIICDRYAKVDSRIKVIHKEYGGVSSARNMGVQAAQGEYIGFVDGDDRIDKDMYKTLLTLCEDTDSEIAVCKLGREIDGQLINDSNEEFVKEMNNTEAMKELFKGVLYRFSLCNKLFKKSCFKNVEFPEGRIHEDLSTTYKLFAQAKKSIYTNYIGYIYVKRSNSILTSTFNEKRLDAFIGWEEILQFMNSNYPELSREIMTGFVYNCIDNVYYILNQVESEETKKKYIINIQTYINRHYKKIMENKMCSLKYKYLISLLNFDIRLLILLDNLKKVFKA